MPTTSKAQRHSDRDGFKHLVLAWRIKHALTQAAAAAVLGVPQRTWQDWEYGRRAPRGLALELIIAKLTRKN